MVVPSTTPLAFVTWYVHDPYDAILIWDPPLNASCEWSASTLSLVPSFTAPSGDSEFYRSKDNPGKRELRPFRAQSVLEACVWGLDL